MATRAPTVRVVRATRKHLDILTEVFIAYLTFYRRLIDRGRVREFLAERIARKESVVFLAIESTPEGPRAVGFAQLYPTFSSLQQARAWVLNDLFTIPSRRRSGVAHLLLSAARTMAVGTSACYIEMVSGRGNHTAARVYESVGYRRDDSTSRFELDLKRR